MIKEVRLNDKMWFGKYKNLSIRDIICKDRMYLESLMLTGKIKYSENVEKYLKEKTKEKPSWADSNWYSGRTTFRTTISFQDDPTSWAYAGDLNVVTAPTVPTAENNPQNEAQ